MTLTSKFDLRRYNDRLKTFVNWPVTFLPAERMASNGFYYIGPIDQVRCIFCKVRLLNWVEEDDPTEQHRHWSPHCRFVCKRKNVFKIDINSRLPLQKGLGYFYDSSWLDTFMTTENWQEIIWKYSNNLFVLHTNLNSIENITCLSNEALQKLPDSVHPFYESEYVRLLTFQHSWNNMHQSPENLAEAGFFYVGPEDETKCYYCDGTFKDWQPDNVPWEEHARWFGTCGYVKLVKGQNYIQKVRTKECSKLEPITEKESLKNRTVKESLQKTDMKMCVACDKAVANVCFLPCSHIVTCSKCSFAVSSCLTCPRKISTFFTLNFEK